MTAATTRTRTAPGNARRSRANHPAALTLPEAKPGKFHVVLVRGRRYHLMSSDQTFEQGVLKEVDQATFEWLAEHAVDAISYVDPELGKVRRVLRKFASSPPLDEVAAETYSRFRLKQKHALLDAAGTAMSDDVRSERDGFPSRKVV